MDELLVQIFLRSGFTLENLEEEFAVKSSRHSNYDNLVHLKYDQINTDWKRPLPRECRGLILNESDNWNVIARPFDKFFNYGEEWADEIDWHSAKVQEKLDGSLCILYEYDDLWHVATTGTPDGRGKVSDFAFDFKMLFFSTLGADRLPGRGKPLTYLFELMTPWNRVVVSHQTPRAVLLAVRHNETGEYVDPLDADWPNDKPEGVQSFNISKLDDIIASFENINPLEQEGYVVVDKFSNRIKVKHPGYVAIHHAVFGLSQRRMTEIVLSGEVPEVLTAFPELEMDLKSIKNKIDTYCIGGLDAYRSIQDIQNQKEFAEMAKRSPYSVMVFCLRTKPQETPYGVLRGMTTRRVMELCGIRSNGGKT